MTHTKKLLFDPLFLKESSQRTFVAFVSGLNLGGLGDSEESQNALLCLANFFRGEHPNEKWRALSAQVTRLVIAGDSLHEHNQSDEVRRESYRA